MALPSRPNARVGLPTNPSPRSRSLVGTRVRPGFASERPNSSASEPPPQRTFSPPPLPRPAGQIRHQQSLSNLSVRGRSQASEHGWERPPPPRMPPVPPVPPLPKARPAVSPVDAGESDIMDYYTGAYAERKNSDASVSPSSASSSSGSSHSSLDLSDVDNSGEGGNGSHGYLTQVPAGFGSSLWGRVAAAAGNLTVSVSKAWATNVPKLGGEDTPPGQESRLTRAMKAYHIEKAQQPADLPGWLFQERERGGRRAVDAQGREDTSPRGDDPRPARAAPPQDAAPAPEVRRDHTVIKHESIARARDAPSGALDGGQEHTSQAVQRLRQMRSAKRLAKVRFADDDDEEHISRPSTMLSLDVAIPNSSLGVNESANWGVSPEPVERGRKPSARVGLPSSVRIRRN